MPEDQNSIFRRLFKSGILLIVGLALEMLISFAAKVLMARLLGKPAFGVATIGITILSFASTVLLFGLNSGTARYLPRFEKAAERKGIIISGLQVALGGSIGAALLLFVFADPIATEVLRSPETVSVLRIAAIGIPFAVLLKFSVGVVQGLQRSLPKVLIRNIAQPIIRFTLVVGALFLGLGSAGIVGAFSATFAVVGLAGLYYVYTRTDLTSSTPGRMRRGELLRFSAPLMLTATMIMVMSYFDIFLLSFFKTDSVVATYGVIYPLSELLTATLSAFSFITMPVLSQLHADKLLHEMNNTYKIITKWIFMATLPAALVIILFPAMTIRLTFGAEYVNGALALRILALGFFTHAVAGPNVNALTSIGETRIIMWDNLAAGTANILLNILLIPPYGIVGAAIATTIAYGGLNVVYSVQLYRQTGIHPVTPALVRPATVGLVSMFAVYTIALQIFNRSVPVLLGVAASFAVVYGIAVLMFGGIEEEEVMLLLSFEERFGVNLGPLKRVAKIFIG